MAKFTCTRPIQHNGKDYAEGQPIDLEKAHSEPLLAVGAIEPAAKGGKKPEGEDTGQGGGS